MSPAHAVRAGLRYQLRVLLASPQHKNSPERETVRGIMRDRNVSDLTLHELRQCITILDPADTLGAPMPATPTPDDTVMLLPDPDPAETDEAEADGSKAEAEAVERAVAEVRGHVVNGGFIALDEQIRSLVIAARKPAVIVRETVTVEVPAIVGVAKHVTQAAPTDKTVTWKQAFGVRGALGSRTATLWNGAHPDTPAINPAYVWPERTAVVLTQISRGRNVYLWGPAGCGKTEFCQQMAARLGRPFVLISCDNATDAAALVGMTVPDKNGGVTFQAGQLVQAIQTPGAIVCIDEPSVARPGALFVFQNVLTPNRALYIQETGARVPVAKNVIFCATDNTNGTGGGARRGFHGTSPLNAATLDRFGARVKIGWHDNATEAGIILKAVPGCPQGLADLLVQAATTTRAAADSQVLTEGLGLRRLFSWAELLTDGIDPETAFQCAIQDCVPETERETLRQQCMLAVDKNTVARAMAGDPTSGPAVDFDVVDNVTGA